jgi:hypothetical protein
MTRCWLARLIDDHGPFCASVGKYAKTVGEKVAGECSRSELVAGRASASSHASTAPSSRMTLPIGGFPKPRGGVSAADPLQERRHRLQVFEANTTPFSQCRHDPKLGARRWMNTPDVGSDEVSTRKEALRRGPLS